MADFSRSNSGTLITTVGEILVEIMSLDVGNGFQECQQLRGPYASGAPAIFIDQVAMLGANASMVGAVGDDDFGKLSLSRLKHDGVDVSAVDIIQDKPTAIAFVRYQDDGERNFLFTLEASAATQIDAAGLLEHLEQTTHLHVVGSSMSMATVADYIVSAITQVKNNGGTVSFDPNVRPEIMQDAAMRDRLMHVLCQCDIFLPSAGELVHFCGTNNEQEAVEEVLSLGVSEVVLKKGSLGAAYYSADKCQEYDAFPVSQIDPTGAGDCFGATYVASRLQGNGVDQAMKLACAAGALAVSHQGPMEGNSTATQLLDFIRNIEEAGKS